MSFAAVFGSEWADPGQLAAAAMAAKTGQTFVVWVGAVLAMATKIACGATLGLGLRRWLPLPRVRVIGACICIAMAIWTLVEPDA
jgi:putative Ca2+/H+ antiporter (TMEM165/GDT1 family)